MCFRNRRPKDGVPDLYNVLVEIEVSILGESETYVFNCIRNGQATVIQPMGRSPGSLSQRLSIEDQACITSAVAKVPNNPAIKIERSRVLPQSRAQGRHKPDLYNVLVEIDVSLIGQSSTYVFNCVHDGQLTVVQLMAYAECLPFHDRVRTQFLGTTGGMTRSVPSPRC